MQQTEVYEVMVLACDEGANISMTKRFSIKTKLDKVISKIMYISLSIYDITLSYISYILHKIFTLNQKSYVISTL